MQTTRKSMLAVLVSGLVLGAVAASPASAADRLGIAVAVTRSADAVPFFYALKSGLFEKAGLDVRYDAMASGGAISSALIGKAVDIGFSNVQTLVIAHERKIPFVIAAAGGEYNDAKPTTALVVGGDSAIKTAKDLEGKVVAVGSLQDLQTLSVSAWMTQNGANPAAVRFIESPASAAPALLQQKRADGIVVSQPNLDYAQAGGARILAKTYGSIANRFLVSVWFATEGWARANPEAIARFADVMRRSSEYANAHPDEMDALIHDYAKIPLEVLHKMTHARQSPGVNPVEVQAVIDAAARFKFIEKPFPAKDIIAGS